MHMTDRKHVDDPAIPLLKAHIERMCGPGGYPSQRAYAERFLFRSPSTLYRWLSGTSPIPLLVRRAIAPIYLEAELAPPPGDDA
jgi:hypothetical protein